MRRTLTALAAAALAAAPVFGDTLHLTNGISLNGEVSKNADGTYTLTVDGNQSIYRADEIVTHEKNELNGQEYKQESRDAAEKAERELDDTTGISADERGAVDKLIQALNTSDRGEQRKSIADLVAYGQKHNILKYLLSTLPSLTPETYPAALEAFCSLAPKGTAQMALAEAATHLAVEVRAQALRLMGGTGQPESADYLVRGLVDPAQEVRLAAAAALGVLGSKRATPALIASLENNTQLVQGAVHQSLTKIWSDTTVPEKSDPAAWEQLWSAEKAGVGSPLTLDAIEPLVDPNKKFVAG